MGKFAKGHKLSKGRPKGSPNALTKVAREVIQGCAESLGGMDRMVAWVKEDPTNERIFWSSIYPRLVPIDVTTGGEKISVTINVPPLPDGGPER